MTTASNFMFGISGRKREWGFFVASDVGDHCECRLFDAGLPKAGHPEVLHIPMTPEELRADCRGKGDRFWGFVEEALINGIWSKR